MVGSSALRPRAAPGSPTKPAMKMKKEATGGDEDFDGAFDDGDMKEGMKEGMMGKADAAAGPCCAATVTGAADDGTPDEPGSGRARAGCTRHGRARRASGSPPHGRADGEREQRRFDVCGDAAARSARP